MKRKNLIGLTSILTLFMFSSCEEGNDDEQNMTSVDMNEISSFVISGDWQITYFFDTDEEETSDFNGYSFVFGSNGVLTASNGTQEIAGSWSITDSSSSDDDDPDSDVDFNISFSAPDNFEDLSDDWDIVSYSATRIELIDISGGNGGTDRLIFDKS